MKPLMLVLRKTMGPAPIGRAQLGFRQVGILPAIGFKHGRWVDSVLMQRALGPGCTSLPPLDARDV